MYKKINFVKDIKSFLDTLKDESLAYLSLITKTEIPFRNAFVFYLHQKMEKTLPGRTYTLAAAGCISSPAQPSI